VKVQARISKLDETLMNRKKPRRMRYSLRPLAPTQNQHVVWYLLDTRTVLIRVGLKYLLSLDKARLAASFMTKRLSFSENLRLAKTVYSDDPLKQIGDLENFIKVLPVNDNLKNYYNGLLNSDELGGQPIGPSIKKGPGHNWLVIQD